MCDARTPVLILKGQDQVSKFSFQTIGSNDKILYTSYRREILSRHFDSSGEAECYINCLKGSLLSVVSVFFVYFS